MVACVCRRSVRVSVVFVCWCLCLSGRSAEVRTEPQCQTVARNKRAERSARERLYCVASRLCVLFVCRVTWVCFKCVCVLEGMDRAIVWRGWALTPVSVGVGLTHGAPVHVRENSTVKDGRLQGPTCGPSTQWADRARTRGASLPRALCATPERRSNNTRESYVAHRSDNCPH